MKKNLKKVIVVPMALSMVFTTVNMNLGLLTNNAYAVENSKEDNYKYKEIANKTIDEICEEMSKYPIDPHYHELMISFNKLGREIPTKWIEDLHVEKTDFNVSTRQMLPLSCLAVNIDPTNVEGVDLIEELYNNDYGKVDCDKDDDDNDKVSEYGYTFRLGYALLCLNGGNFNIPESAKWNKDKIINKLVYLQFKDLDEEAEDRYSWSDNGNFADISTMSTVISALAPYYNKNKDVKEVVDKGLKTLSEMQNDDGTFSNGNYSCVLQTSYAIIGLCELGIDIDNDERFIKNGNTLIDGLLKFKTEDKKGFSLYFDKRKTKEFDEMCTERGLRALVAYKNLKEHKGSIYKFDFKDEDFKIKNLTNPKDFQLGKEGTVKVNINNYTKEEKEATLIVGVYDDNNKLVDSYVAPKSTVKINSTVNLEGKVKIPTSGQYEVKAFIWDNLDDMNSHCKEIKIPIEKAEK